MSPFNKLLFASVAAMAVQARAGELIVEVQGLASEQGQVMLAAYTSADDWMKKPVAVLRAPAAGGSVLLRIKDLPEGASVALSLFHDLNGNGRMDTNAMGVPQEPFGFSRNAVGNFGPPKFEQAAVQLPVAGGRIVVTLN